MKIIKISKIRKYNYIIVASMFTVSFLVNGMISNPASAAVQSLVFPVIGKSSYSNDFNASRANGAHHATDIIAKKRQKIVSASTGTIRHVTYWEGAGYSVRILGTDGFVYNYYHLNNDTPGTDDGKGGQMKAYAPDVEPGNRVVKGQLIGYVGDSGNSEETVSHLHFEIYDIRSGGSVGNPMDGGKAVNPYSYLNKATRISKQREYPALTGEILPYGTGTFRGGSRIAAGDVDNDGVDEIIVGAGEGGRYVKVFEKNGTQISGFQPNGPSFYGGVDVAAGDVDGDGVDEIITGAGKGGRYVKVFEKDGTQKAGFMPINKTFDGGISVAVGDVRGDAAVEIIAAAKQTGGPKVTINTVSGVQLATFYAYSNSFKGGVMVETAEVDNRYAKQELMTIAQSGGSSKIRLRSGTAQMIRDMNPTAESWWIGYYDITAVGSEPMTSLNINRRTSLRIAQ